MSHLISCSFIPSLDGGSEPGVFARDQNSEKYFTILEKIFIDDDNDESTGLAFCDDARRMIIAFQDDGRIYEVS